MYSLYQGRFLLYIPFTATGDLPCGVANCGYETPVRFARNSPLVSVVHGEGNMRPVKRVLLGSAASLFAVAGAQAADLPVKAKPVEYVKVCTLYGAGFWYVPGTDTCIKIGMY